MPQLVTKTGATADAPHALAAWWRSRYGARFLYELAIVTGLLITYRAIRGVSKTDLVTAFQNAYDVIRFETWLGLPFEDDLQRWLLAHPAAIKSLNLYYVVMHFPAAIALLLWLYFRHPDRYRAVRNLMAVVTFAALVIHLIYPLAPPRMMRDFVDTMAVFGPNIYPANALEGAANQIAAMPSLHFGWAMIEAMAVIWVLKSRWRWLALLHPILMALCIIATANHWWLDAAAAGAIIGLTAVCGQAAGRIWSATPWRREESRSMMPDST